MESREVDFIKYLELFPTQFNKFRDARFHCFDLCAEYLHLGSVFAIVFVVSSDRACIVLISSSITDVQRRSIPIHL